MLHKPELHDYVDFRAYLREMLAWQREQGNPQFLQRNLLAKLGVSSTGFISNLLAGRKSLMPTQTRRFAEILELSDSESHYFETLVHYGQSRDELDKAEWLEKLTRLQKVRLKQLEGDQLSLFSRPELVFLYELLTFRDVESIDPESLGQLFLPPLSTNQVTNAIQDLTEIGLLARNSKGRLHATENAVGTAQNVQSHALRHFHEKMLQLANQGLTQIPHAERDYSVLTLGLSEESFCEIRNELMHFRRRLIALALQDTHPDRLYQFNIQLFPVTGVLPK